MINQENYRKVLCMLLNVRVLANDELWRWVPLYKRLLMSAEKRGLAVEIVRWTEGNYSAKWGSGEERKELTDIATLDEAVLRGLWERLGEAGALEFHGIRLSPLPEAPRAAGAMREVAREPVRQEAAAEFAPLVSAASTPPEAARPRPPAEPTTMAGAVAAMNAGIHKL